MNSITTPVTCPACPTTERPTTTPTDLDALASTVRLKKEKVAQYRRGYLLGQLTYDDLAEAGKELSSALFEYSRAKFPSVKPRRMPYQALIR